MGPHTRILLAAGSPLQSLSHYFTGANTGSQTSFTAPQFTPDSTVALESEIYSDKEASCWFTECRGCESRKEEQIRLDIRVLWWPIKDICSSLREQQKYAGRCICVGYLLLKRLLHVKRKCYCCVFPHLPSGKQRLSGRPSGLYCCLTTRGSTARRWSEVFPCRVASSTSPKPK